MWSNVVPGCSLRAVLLALALVPAAIAASEDDRDIAGRYAGEIASQAATLHIRIRPNGTLAATLDNLDASKPWMFVCAEVKRNGSTLSFTVPIVHASFRGEFAAGQQKLTGTWTQSNSSVPVTFTRETFIPAAKPSALDGIWLGTPQATGNSSSRTQIVFRSDANGREYCTLDLVDLYDYMDMECANVVFQDDQLSFDVPVVGVHWTGKLQSGGNTLHGEAHQRVIQGGSSQDLSTPLDLARQTSLLPEKPQPSVTYDAALPPVGATQIEAVLLKDLAGALQSGELAEAYGEGVSIGVYTHGISRVFSFGAARPDSVFEIGSLTRPLTGLLLAQMAAQQKVRLDEPVRELLPPGTVAKPEGPEITLLDLASQRSGLPAMPDNISVANMDQPYADYHVADLMTYLGKRGVANPARATSNFSTLGFALLGDALAMRAGTAYAKLLEHEITAPLAMADTVFALSPQQQARLLPGHDQFHGPAQAWTSDALAPAIGLRSTAQDMLTFLIANLHPDQIRAMSGGSDVASLQAAIRQSQQIQTELLPGMHIAMGWLYQDETGKYWHSGATAAYSVYAFFNPNEDFAAVVLLNASPGVNGSFVENLGRHVYQRLTGKPALSLNP